MLRRTSPRQDRDEQVARMRQFGERVYVYKTLLLQAQQQQQQCDDDDPGCLRLEDLKYLDLVNAYRSNNSVVPSDEELAAVLTTLAAQMPVRTAPLCRLEVSQKIQELLQNINQQAFLHLLSGLTHLRHLKLGTITLEILQHLEASGCTESLEHLETSRFHERAPEEQHLMISTLSNFKCLQSLVCKTRSFRWEREIELISQTAPALPQLSSLHLEVNSSLRNFQPFDAVQCIQQCLLLQEVVLSDWKLDTTACVSLADAVATHPRLQRWVLHRCQISQPGWEAILLALQKNKTLREFSIAETRVLRSQAHGIAASYPVRVMWERLALLLQNYNHALHRVEHSRATVPLRSRTTVRIWRLLELNQSGFRQHLEEAKLGPFILSIASHSPTFMFPILRNNVETLLVRHYHGTFDADGDTDNAKG